jgi:NTE family protein
MLGDGGLSLNAPFDLILEAEVHGNLVLYVIDLYAREGTRPRTLEEAAERKSDLLFGNQTFIRLQYSVKMRQLRKQLKSGSREATQDEILLLSYRPGSEEPGLEKSVRACSGRPRSTRRCGRAIQAKLNTHRGGFRPGL